ncbi:hypothetical protein M758_7G180300 [Ceratodon purpureus]|nr:hypothetical protein M758_7G180300 [Ceratodon purpureus]
MAKRSKNVTRSVLASNCGQQNPAASTPSPGAAAPQIRVGPVAATRPDPTRARGGAARRERIAQAGQETPPRWKRSIGGGRGKGEMEWQASRQEKAQPGTVGRKCSAEGSAVQCAAVHKWKCKLELGGGVAMALLSYLIPSC